MERPDRPLPLLGAAAALVVVALSLWVVLGGAGDQNMTDVARAAEAVAPEERGALDPS